jgi:5-methylcytosine-specific restriction endonuclease McrA
MPFKDKDKQRKYDRLWHQKRRESYRKYQQKLRRKVIELLGGKCVNCGCDEYSMLEINHKNGGGHKEMDERRRCYKSWYLDILAGRRSRDDLETRCIVCNALHKAKDLNKAKGNWTVVWTA